MFSCSVVSDSLRPQELQPTKLLYPWDSAGKKTGLGHHLDPGIEPASLSPALAGGLFTASATWEARVSRIVGRFFTA